MMAGTPEPGTPGGDDAPAPYPGDQSGHINPALQQVTDNAATDMGSAWSGVAANRIQDYLTSKAVAQQSQAAGDQLVNNLDGVKKNLTGMVQGDPGAIDLALDLAQHTVNGIVDQHQHMDDDARAGIASDLTGHLQSEIAHTGVQRLAEIDHGAAMDALDKYGHLLPDDQQAGLRQYAAVQQGARQQDAQAAQQQSVRDASVAGYHAASQYLHSLTDPDTGAHQNPPGFVASVIADPRLAQPTRLALHAGYSMLQQNGDPPSSDPHVVSDFIGRMAGDVQPLRPGGGQGNAYPPGVTGDLLGRMQDRNMTGYSVPGTLPVTMPQGAPGKPANEAENVLPEDQGSMRRPGTPDPRMERLDNLRNENEEPVAPPSGNFDRRLLPQQQASATPPQQYEIMAHLGTGLRVNDAAFLNGLLGPKTPSQQSDIRDLSSVMQQARNTLAHPANGPAGEQAFGKFTNWLLPALQRGGNLGELTASNQIQKFAPTASDYRAAVPRTGVNDRLVTMAQNNMRTADNG